MSRQFSITVDKYGIDPLKDMISESLRSVNSYVEHTVSEDEIGHSGLLSLKYYDDENFGHVILEYNGLGHELNMVAGSTIKIPNISQLKSKVQVKSSGRSVIKRTVSI